MALSKLERSILEVLQDNPDHAYTTQELSSIFNYRGSKNYKKLVKALAFLERIEEVYVTPQGKFKTKQNQSRIEGVYRANERGFGFIEYAPDEPDFFVPRGRSGGAMNGDRVEARVIKHVDPATGKGSEAEIIRVIERQQSQLVGEFIQYDQSQREESGYIGFVEPQGTFPSETRVYILPEGVHPAAHSIVTLEIKTYPTPDKPHQMVGYATREIGHKDAPGVDILTILYQFNIPTEFPEEVLEEASQVPQTIQAEDLDGRVDVRDQLVFTIDGADAKDLDDAIGLEVLEGGRYRLSVHIADVSHYVQEGSPMDLEAYERGTSVYLTDRVVPMLPQRLSNGICSLNPREDRLTLTCEMVINSQGHVESHKIYESVIHSDYRMTYDDVNEIIAGNEALRETYAEITPTIDAMVDLHHILEDMRISRGALNFDTEEAYIKVDEDGHPLDIQLRERQTGERLIESFMLVANETVAKDFKDRQYPFIYRIHEQPDTEKLDRFAEFITSFGMILRGNTENMRPKQLQEVMAKVADEAYEPVVSMMLLRSMQQAKYSEEPHGHYGLAAQDYTHFTSPIRRYPDLIVHRLIHKYLKGQPSGKERARLEKRLPVIADHSSKMERRAVEAERETDALKKAEFMADKVGEQYEGMITSVTNFGMFAQLPNTVEGLIRLDGLDDYYNFHPDHLILVGERKGGIFRIGQKVTIEVEQVNIDERQIDFKLIDAEAVDPADVNIQPQKAKRSDRQKQHGKSRRKKSQDHKSKQRSRKGKAKKQNFKLRKRK